MHSSEPADFSCISPRQRRPRLSGPPSTLPPERTKSDLDAFDLALEEVGSSCFAELVSSHSEGLKQAIRRAGIAHEHDVEDVLQDVWLKAFRNRITDDIRIRSPKAWLVIVARNKATDRLRQARRRAETSDPSLLDIVVDDRPWEATRVNVSEALEVMTSELRSVAVLRYIEERSIREVQDLLGLSTRTLFRRIDEVKKTLHELLAP